MIWPGEHDTTTQASQAFTTATRSSWREGGFSELILWERGGFFLRVYMYIFTRLRHGTAFFWDIMAAGGLVLRRRKKKTDDLCYVIIQLYDIDCG
jgi:hypothetical protein